VGLVIRRLLAAALLTMTAGSARAASSSWIGGAVGDWNVPSNWTAGVPGPSDDASISSAFVIAYATNPALSVTNLTLGSGGVLNLSVGLTASGLVNLLNGAALQFGATVPFSVGTLTLAQGSSATYVGPPFPTSPVPALTLQANTLNLAAGSTITVSGRGYAGGIGGGSPSAGAGPSGGGGVGSGSTGGGGGGGGLVFLRESASISSVLSSTLTVQTANGLGGAAAAVGADGLPGSLYADPRQWTAGGGDNLASDPLNWNLGLVPAGGENVVFGSSATSIFCSWDLGSVAVGSVTVTTSFSTSVILAASMTVTGSYTMAGGTFAAAAGLDLSLGGAFAQSGGRFDLLGSTLTLVARGISAPAAFFDARAGLLAVGAAGVATATVTGALTSVTAPQIMSAATLSLSTVVLTLDGNGPFAGAGTVVFSTFSTLSAAGASAQNWIAWPGTLGYLNVVNPAGLTLSTVPSARFQIAGTVTVSTGALLTATSALIEVGGDWANYGTATLNLSTVAFKALSGTQAIVAGGTFDNLVVDNAGATLRLSTWVVVGSSVGVLSGTFDLAAGTINARGRWSESVGARVLPGASVAVFDGIAPQTVYQLGVNSFGAFMSSCAGGVTISSTLATAANFEWHSGNLSFPGATLQIGGDMLRHGGILLNAAGSQTIFTGSSTQTVAFSQLGDFVDANTGAGVRLGAATFSVGSFRVRPGSIFDAGGTAVTMIGSVWDTSFSTYLAASPAHTVLWQPAGTVTVGAGSVVNARLSLDVNKTAVLLGDLNVGGPGNLFDPRFGSTVVNAPGGSTIAFRGSANLIPSSGASWTYGGDVANSWLVFEGSGTARGASVPTNAFGTLRVSLNTPGDVFKAGSLNLGGRLIVEGGTLRPNGSSILSIGGDVLQTGGVVDFATFSSGTVRLVGTSTQTIKMLAGSHSLWHLTDASTGTVSAASDLTVRGDFVVSTGTFLAGAGNLAFQGLVQISTAGAFAGQASTVTLDGATGGVTVQKLAVFGAAAFNGLAVNVLTANVVSSVTAAVFTDRIAGGTLTVTAGAEFAVADLRLGPPAGARLTVQSSVPGTPWFLNVTSISSATAVSVSDSDASPGLPIVANDGRSFDGGGNVNWNFRPLLLVLLPGETFTPSVPPGKSGVPTISTAGVPVLVTVIAVTSRYEQSFASTGTVSLTSDDAFALLPAPLTLTSGTTALSFTPLAAEPAPRATRITASSFFGSGVSTAAVIPAGLAKLQIVMFGETVLPGSPTGRFGVPFANVRGLPFSATVRAVDAYWNKVATVTDSIAMGDSASSSTVPAPPALAAGAAVENGLVIYTTGFFTLSATDVTNPAVAAAISQLFGVVPPSVSSPTGSFYIPTGAAIPTLGGAISGTAADSSAVGRVRVDVLEVETGFHYDGVALAFSAAAPIFATTTLASPLAPSTSWSNPIPDSALVSGRHYAATALVDDPTGFTGIAMSTFVVNRAALTFGSKSGLGTAAALPAATAGCAPVIATVTFTVGAGGIVAGGAVAVRVPAGWDAPSGVSAAFPPPSGFWNVRSTSPAFAPSFSTTTVNPASFGGQALGAGWLTLAVATGSATGFSPGEQVVFTYADQPPLSPAGRGPQAFAVWTTADATGPLAPISSQPAVNLTAGATNFLAFADSTPLNLGPLQVSPTIQLKIVDLCGNDKPGASSGTATISLVVPLGGSYVADSTARFYGPLGSTISAVVLSSGVALSQGFTMTTSTSGPALAYIQAVSSFSAVSSSVSVTALRAVRLSASPSAFTSVSVDSGTLAPGTTSVALSATAPDAYAARLVFTLADPALTWDAVLSLDPVGFSSPTFRASGFGDPSKPQVLTWDGVDRVSVPPRYAPPGRYRARLRAAGGSALNTALEVVVATTPGYAGRLGAVGAGAAVSASGPGASDGAYATASSTGYFVLYGLRAGQSYQVIAATSAFVGGVPTALTVAVAAPPAAQPLTDLGSVVLPVPARVRVAAILPVAAPFEAVGGYVGRAADGSAAFSGAIRFSTGAAVSDDGGPLFGRAASTWSVAFAVPGVYTLELDVPDLRLSTSIASVTVGAGGLDFIVPLDKRAGVTGWAILPSAAPAGATISVQAAKAGASAPSVFGAVLTASSGPYALFGLDPGTWTVTASAPGYVAVSTTILIPDASDVTGLNLTLGAGGTIVGTVTVSGNSLGAVQCFAGVNGAPGACPAGTFDLSVEALAVGTLDRGAARVRMTASPTSSTAAFAITGLAPGLWTLRSSLRGFALSPAGGLAVSVAAAASSTSSLSLAPLDARLALTVLLPPLPGGACRSAGSWSALGLTFDAADGASRTFGDATALSGAGSFETLNCSSATFFSPALPPGPARAAALFAPSGAWGFARAALSDGTTAALTLDLTASSVPATGSLSFSGLVSLSTRTAAGVPYSVAATSAAGILSAAPNVAFCLLGARDPLAARALRAELVPYDPLSGTPALRRASGGAGSCAAIPASTGAATSLGFAAAVNADGSFTFSPGVMPGLYLLRVPGDLDDNPADGAEAVESDQLVTVGLGGAVFAPRLTRGARASGTLAAPAGMPPGRLFHLSLIGPDGKEARAADVAPVAGAPTAFGFDGVGDGRYVLTATDQAVPRAFAAAPLSFTVSGADVVGLALTPVAAGTVRARLAAARPLPDGTQSTVLITRDNAGLLGPRFTATATADPAAPGAVFVSRAASDGSLVDALGRITVDGLPPGTYDLVFAAPPDPAALGAGALALTPARVAGVTVAAGQVADLGVVPLFSGSFAAGRVTDAATGLPVAGLRVSARPSGGAAPGAAAAALSATTDASGGYLLRGLDPVQRWYDVTAAPRGMMVSGSPLPPYAARRVLGVDVSSGAFLDFALAPAANVIVGRVASSGGAALTSSLGPGDPVAPGAALTLQAGGVPPSDDPLSDLALRTAADGTFVIPSVAAGSYRLTASALGQSGAVRSVVVLSSVTNLGVLTLGGGGILTGAVRLPDGSAPSTDEVQAIAAAAADSSEFLYAALTLDPTGRSVAGYSVSGLTPGRAYRLIVAGPGGSSYVPPEGSSVVLASSSDVRAADLTLRPGSGPVSFRARRAGTRWTVTAQFPRPVRARFAADSDPAVLLTTSSAAGALSGGRLSADLRSVTAFYDPGPGETTAVFRASAALAATDWSSSNPAARELVAGATASLALTGDGLTRAVAANALGATLTFDGDAGRVVLPRGAFAVDAASSVAVSFSRSASAAAYAAGAPPAPLAGSFYDVSLPPGVPTVLARPAELTLAYSTSVADSSRLHAYWYNPAAGAYILQPDALGAPLTVDSSARTVTLRVNHFSTYVLLDSAAGVIGGSPFAGGDLDAYNFPNPFDLSVKTVTTIHGGGSPSVRGTLVRVAVPTGLSGGGTFRVFEITGRLIRTVDLGALSGGQVYYQAWDGRNDAGVDVASGLYLGQVEVGGRRKTFKMAVLK
jgi:hypothetical protein